MVVFKEDYDLTCRTPTPPAQRQYRLQARRRQQQRERHLASVRGKFDAKRRQNNDDTDSQQQQQQPQAVTRWGGIQTGRSADQLASIDAMGSDPSFGSFVRESPTTGRRLSSAGANVSFGGMNQSRNASFSFNPNAPMQGVSTLKAPLLTNDSFSTFFGGGGGASSSARVNARVVQSPLATQAASVISDAINDGHHPHRYGSDDIFGESGGLPQAKDDDDDDYHQQHQQHFRERSPPCGFDTLEDQNSLFIGEKRISGEDHFERYRFDVGADDIRDAAVVREFKRLVIDGRHREQNQQQQQQDAGGVACSPQRGGVVLSTAARAMSAQQSRRNNNNNNLSARANREVNSLASCRQSADPRQQQDVIEGLLGTTQAMAAPSAIEREAIRMLRVASASTKTGGRSLLPSTSARSGGGDLLSGRLASSVSGSKTRGTSPQTPNGTEGATTVASGADYNSNKTAANSVPRPPPGYYKRVSGRAQNDARVFTAQAQHLAAHLEQQDSTNPDPLHHRPPFRLRAPDKAGGGFSSTASQLPHESPRANYRRATSHNMDEEEFCGEKHLSQVEVQQKRRIERERALEEDVQEDLRCFEWRRSAQQHARQMAKVQVAREKELAVFEKRQCDKFRDALARFEPGALRRTEQAIQHRIAHELVNKYGPAAFLSGGGAATDRDVKIPASFQVCAREAALVAAETAKAERQQEDRRRKQLVAQTIAHHQPQAKPTVASPRRRFSSVSFGGTGQQPQPPSSSAPTTTAKKGKASMTNYVDKNAIESSGYGESATKARSLLPNGKAACVTEENEAFIGSARAVRDEIDALEQRCPGLSSGHASPQLLRRS